MRQFLPIFTIAFLVTVLIVFNYHPITFLTGWDNLHPEFDFWVNIKRSIFAVWQEYQGLGLLGGMGHATDLPRQLFLWVVSFALPTSALRYFYHFLMLFLGSLGVYLLLKRLLLKDLNQGKEEIYSLFGALFYFLNLATVQMFYVPYEAFSAHFAALPWLLFSVFMYLQNPTRKYLLFFLLVLLLSTPQAYIPTLLVVFLLVLPIVTFPLAFRLNQGRKYIFQLVKLFLFIFLINAFWLLPFLYFTFTNSHVNVEAKINQMATDTIFSQNKEFGNLTDVILLKGFWFNNVDPNLQGNFAYMMAPWRTHLANPLVTGVGYFLFVIILLGIFASIKSRKPILLGFVALFIFSFTMLATNTPPFSWFDILFRKIPLFNQAFRFPFTKFSILAGLTYAIFFAIGVQTIVHIISARIISYELRTRKIIHVCLFLIPTFLLLLFVFPAFQGHFFYQKERLIIPREYFELADFFRKQDSNTRIANFPQHAFWGWNFYRWGYGGSGFLWYGVKQPILDRAFDVWSHENENYYFEVSYAIYSKNPTLFRNVLDKYQINWLLVDKNIINPQAPKALFFSEFKDLTKNIPSITQAAAFGNIDIYKVNLNDKPQSFVFLDNNLDVVNGYRTGELDFAYLDNRNYISTFNPPAGGFNSFYPFRSLFTNKLQKDIEFSVHEGYDDTTFTALIPPAKEDRQIKIPFFLDKEELLPVDIITKRGPDKEILIVMKFYTPSVSLDNKQVFQETVENLLFTVSSKSTFPLQLEVNGVTNYTITSDRTLVARTFLSTKVNNIFILKDSANIQVQTEVVSAASLQTLEIGKEIIIPISPSDSPQELTIKTPRVNDGYVGMSFDGGAMEKVKNCDNFRREFFSSTIEENSLKLYARNATACTSIFLPTLFHRQGYLFSIGSKHIAGKPLHFWLLNDDEQFVPIDTYLSANSEWSVNAFVLAPQDPFGKSYSLHFDNASIGKEETINQIGQISLYPIPYNFLTSIVVTTNQPIKEQLSLSILSVDHPNESIYVVRLEPKQNTDFQTLVLSQSFNNGWKAYKIKNYESGIMNYANLALPFIFGKELKDHVLVNNWENGWRLDNSQLSTLNSQLVIIFLPQYLEYIGLILIPFLLGWILRRTL